MSDLIDRQVAIDALTDKGHQSAKKDGVDSSLWEGIMIARRIIKNLPSAQSELIRCKDCKYACIDTEREFDDDEIYCSENDFWKGDDFYCGYAERRTDG